MGVLDCGSVLQAWMPSYHVYSSLALPAVPQSPNQEPPRPQQLIFPDFAMMPHLGHTELIVVVESLQASTPSDHLCLAFLLPAPPQFLNQAPPGAQQLNRPDFLKLSHFGHVISLLELMDVVIGALTISSRSDIGR